MKYGNVKSQQIYFNVKKRKSDKLTSNILSVATIFCAIISLFVLSISSIYYSAEVVGLSMAPSINSSSYFEQENAKNEIAYYTTYKQAKKGDIVIVDYESANIREVDAIKRLIAVGGDTICYYNGSILINGKQLTEKYIDDGYEKIKDTKGKFYADQWKQTGYEISKQNFENFCQNVIDGIYKKTTFAKNYQTTYDGYIQKSEVLDTYVLTVPEGYVFFLGDNRGGSIDSSTFGPIEEKYLLVKVDYIVPYGTNIFSAIWKNLF